MWHSPRCPSRGSGSARAGRRRRRPAHCPRFGGQAPAPGERAARKRQRRRGCHSTDRSRPRRWTQRPCQRGRQPSEKARHRVAGALVGEYHANRRRPLGHAREGFARLDAREITPRRPRGPRRRRPRRDEAEELQRALDAASRRATKTRSSRVSLRLALLPPALANRRDLLVAERRLALLGKSRVHARDQPIVLLVGQPLGRFRARSGAGKRVLISPRQVRFDPVSHQCRDRAGPWPRRVDEEPLPTRTRCRPDRRSGRNPAHPFPRRPCCRSRCARPHRTRCCSCGGGARLEHRRWARIESRCPA